MTAVASPLDFAAADDFASHLESLSGANILACYQCRKCSSGCPVAGNADLQPHELVLLAQLGQKEALLQSRMIWECTSCHTCATRCPQQVNIAAMNDALRQLSRKHGMVTAQTTVPLFNDIFLRTVRRFGRMHEIALMAAYKLRTKKFMDDVTKFPMMLVKRKLALLPGVVRGSSERKRLFGKSAGDAE
jgi:heterodisulfide reductase subunit C